ncbi:MAG TPA: ribose 5-phosphate isomerase B [bacterium]|nr:ribose 5-phosphate isomerase B [bacterium]
MSAGSFTILFIDRKGSFRAPVAAFLLRQELKKTGHEDVTVLAAGIEAEEGQPLSPFDQETLFPLPTDSMEPVSHKVGADLVDHVHLALVMEYGQKEWLLEHLPQVSDRLRLLGRFIPEENRAEIPPADPRACTDTRQVFNLVERAVLGLVSRWDEVRNRFFVRQKFDVAVGADHRGFSVKRDIIDYLNKDGYRVTDVGTHSAQACDHPIYAFKVGEMVARQEVDRGVLVCGSGLGMSISANKVPGVRAAMCINPDHAALSRSHNNANVLCLAADCFPEEEEIEIVKVWLKTPFLGGKYQRRINLIMHYGQDSPSEHTR